MAQVRIARSAEADLLDGYVFYERQQAGIHPRPDGRLHRSLADRFPFAIYYELKDNIATVVAVLDCRQNPASITERVG